MMAAMTGGIAQAFYGGVPRAIVEEVLARVPPEFVEVIDAFERQFVANRLG